MNIRIIYIIGLASVTATAFVKGNSDSVWSASASKEEELALLRSRNQATIQYIHHAIAMPYDTLPHLPFSSVAP